jgi:hypothetical protein
MAKIVTFIRRTRRRSLSIGTEHRELFRLLTKFTRRAIQRPGTSCSVPVCALSRSHEGSGGRSLARPEISDPLRHKPIDDPGASSHLPPQACRNGQNEASPGLDELPERQRRHCLIVVLQGFRLSLFCSEVSSSGPSQRRLPSLRLKAVEAKFTPSCIISVGSRTTAIVSGTYATAFCAGTGHVSLPLLAQRGYHTLPRARPNTSLARQSDGRGAWQIAGV